MLLREVREQRDAGERGGGLAPRPLDRLLGLASSLDAALGLASPQVREALTHRSAAYPGTASTEPTGLPWRPLWPVTRATARVKRMDTRTRLEALLRSRIAVLDGAWGVLLQGRGLTEEQFRGERFAAHDRDVQGDPDLLNVTQPAVVAEVHDAYFAAGADIATTNTFTATSFGQRDYGLEDAVVDMNLEGARLAREAADRAGRRTARRRFGRTAERDPLALAEGRRSGVPRGDVRRGRRGLRRADAGAARRRRRPAADRDDLRHAEREGRHRCGEGRRARSPAVDQRHDRRPQRPYALRPDRRGVLDARSSMPIPRSWASTARSAPPRCAPTSRRSRASPTARSPATRTPGCPTRSAGTTRRRRSRAGSCASSPTPAS